MCRQLFAKIGVPAAAMAALLMAGPAGAFPPPPPPMLPGPPPMLPGPGPAGPPFMPRPPLPLGGPPGGFPGPGLPPGGPPGGGFARPNLVPPGPTPLARPNVGAWSPSAPGRGPGAWAPPVVNRGWAPPTANFVTGRGAAVNLGRAGIGDRRPYFGRGNYDWSRYRPLHGYGYGLAGYAAYSYYPYYSDYSSDYGYSPYYGSSSYGGSYSPSGSQSDAGASGPSSQAAPSSPAPSAEGAANTEKETAAVKERMGQAVRAFREGDYAEAQAECERAIRLQPGDANLHEFRALCQFARGQYQGAAATLYDVLAAGPGWGWDTLSSCYPSARTYTEQLRALERYAREHPKEAAGRLVLAYHYLALGERDGAVGQLREVVQLQPEDQVAPVILEALQKAKKGKAEARPAAPPR
jgi:tetratricopeptide (TPR) repeat protein